MWKRLWNLSIFSSAFFVAAEAILFDIDQSVFPSCVFFSCYCLPRNGEVNACENANIAGLLYSSVFRLAFLCRFFAHSTRACFLV